MFNPPNADYSPFRSSGFQPLKGINVSNSPNANYSPIHGGVSLAPKPMIETPKPRAIARVLTTSNISIRRTTRAFARGFGMCCKTTLMLPTAEGTLRDHIADTGTEARTTARSRVI